MSHSHLSVRHYLKRLEEAPADAPPRITLPDWLQRFLSQAAERFEPEEHTARAGYLCRCDQGAWTVALYLGETEWVGGPEDGSRYPMNFVFDLDGLCELFDAVDHLRWHASPRAAGGEAGEVSESAIVIDGYLGSHPLCVEVHMRPPRTAGPGLKRYPDGRTLPA